MKRILPVIACTFLLAVHHADPPLREAASFTVGASVSPRLLTGNPAYRNVLLRELNGITPENAMKFAGLHPFRDSFRYTDADTITSFATANNMRLHGHTLLWHESVPAWLHALPNDSAQWETIIKEHIGQVVKRYKGRVKSWDVVNEAFNDKGELRLADTDTSRKDNGSIWARHLGTDYIGRAFQYAHAADPDAFLFYNDYGQEYAKPKLEAIKNMVADFKRRGIPIHGLGLQMHLHIGSSREGITAAIRELASTGLLIHISELDISVNPKNDVAIQYPDWLQQAQGELFAFVVQEYRKWVPKDRQYGITTWNVGDADSWIRSFYKRRDWPLLFDDDYRRKPAYYHFLNALRR